MFFSFFFPIKSHKRCHHGFETEAASFTAAEPSLTATADCTVSTDMLGDDGPSPAGLAAVGIWAAAAALIKGLTLTVTFLV